MVIVRSEHETPSGSFQPGDMVEINFPYGTEGCAEKNICDTMPIPWTTGVVEVLTSPAIDPDEDDDGDPIWFFHYVFRGRKRRAEWRDLLGLWMGGQEFQESATT